MPVGNGVVLMGMSERTSRQAITQVAAALFTQGAAERVIVAGMPSCARRCTSTPSSPSPTATSSPSTRDRGRRPHVQLRPGTGTGVDVTDEGGKPFLEVVARALGLARCR